MKEILWISPVLALAALFFALWKAHYVNSSSPGNERMQEIAASIAEGADAFLKAEYRILVFFIVALFASCWGPASRFWPVSSGCALPPAPMCGLPMQRWNPA